MKEFEELLKTTEMVLKKHRMPYKAVGKLAEASLKAKAQLNEVVGLNESNLFRLPVSLEKTEVDVRKGHPKTYSVVQHILSEAASAGADIDLKSMSLVRNTVMVKGQENKISKIASKYIKENPEVLDTCMKELGISKYEQFLPKLGDIVKSGRKLWVSSNVLDILAASSNASFTSCHSFGGGHFNGNIAYCCDPFTLVTFITEEKCKPSEHELYKLGRGWVFLLNMDTIVQAKSYGAYYCFEREVAKKILQEKVAAHLGVPNQFSELGRSSISKVSFEKPKDVNRHPLGGALYFDNYDLEITYPKGRKHSADSINFAAAMCLECGITTDYTAKGVCATHDGKIKETCSTCGTQHLLDRLYNINGEYYCQQCYEKSFARCAHCGSDHRKDEMEHIDGQWVCKVCKKKNYSNCVHCGGFHLKANMDDLKGVGLVCASCRENYLMCSICDEYHLKAEVEYYKYVGRVCSKCLPKAATKCSGCGEYFPNTELVNGECPACVAKREGHVVELKEKPKYAGLPEGWDDFVEIVG